MTKVRVQRLAHGADLPLPAYQSALAAGLDLFAAVPSESPIVIESGRWAAIPTGVALALPAGSEGQVRPRSGLAVEHGVTVLNAPGTVDADYRGEIRVVLINLGPQPFFVRRGMRVAQLVVAPVIRADIVDTPELDETVRGASGFGSTGFGAARSSRP